MKTEERQARFGTPVQAPPQMGPVHGAIPMSTRTPGDGGTQIQRGNEDEGKPRREVEHEGQARLGQRPSSRGKILPRTRSSVIHTAGAAARLNQDDQPDPVPGIIPTPVVGGGMRRGVLGACSSGLPAESPAGSFGPPGRKGLLTPRHGCSFPETRGTYLSMYNARLILAGEVHASAGDGRNIKAQVRRALAARALFYRRITKSETSERTWDGTFARVIRKKVADMPPCDVRSPLRSG